MDLQLCTAPCCQRKTWSSEGAWWDLGAVPPRLPLQPPAGEQDSLGAWASVKCRWLLPHLPLSAGPPSERPAGSGALRAPRTLCAHQVLWVGEGAQVKDLGGTGQPRLCRDQLGEPRQPLPSPGLTLPCRQGNEVEHQPQFSPRLRPWVNAQRRPRGSQRWREAQEVPVGEGGEGPPLEPRNPLTHGLSLFST